MMMRKFLIFLIAGSVFCSGKPGYAQLIVDRAKVKLVVSHGQTITDSITVYNSSNSGMSIRVYAEDFNYVSPFDGTKEFFPAGTVKNSCSTWIHFSPQEFQLPPFKGRKVTYSIKVPQDIKGGYYGVLFFEMSPGRMKRGKIDIQVIQRIGCLFFLEAQNRLKRGEIRNISGFGRSIQGEFFNTGDVILIPDGSFYVMDREGMAVERGKIEKFYLPPGESKSFTINFSKKLSYQLYTMVLTFDLEEGDVLVKEIDFEVSKTGLRVIQIRD